MATVAKPRFPDPGPAPKFGRDPVDDAERDRWTNELYDWNMRSLIYQATNFNDPDARDMLALEISSLMESDQPIRRVVRDYLAWLMLEVELPHKKRRGNTLKTDARAWQVRKLFAIMQRITMVDTVEERVQCAADVMGVSYGTARKLYDDPTYARWAAILKNSN